MSIPGRRRAIPCIHPKGWAGKTGFAAGVGPTLGASIITEILGGSLLQF